MKPFKNTSLNSHIFTDISITVSNIQIECTCSYGRHFKKKSSAHALSGISGVAYFITIGRKLRYNKNGAAIFLMQVMLPHNHFFLRFISCL